MYTYIYIDICWSFLIERFSFTIRVPFCGTQVPESSLAPFVCCARCQTAAKRVWYDSGMKKKTKKGLTTDTSNMEGFDHFMCIPLYLYVFV